MLVSVMKVLIGVGRLRSKSVVMVCFVVSMS